MSAPIAKAAFQDGALTTAPVKRAWTDDEIASLRDLRGVRGWDCRSIAAALGRSYDSVHNKADRLGIGLPAKKYRGSARNQAVLFEAFLAGTAIRSTARALDMAPQTVAKAYDRFSVELMRAGSDYTPTGGYVGAREMARIVAPICGAPARAILSDSRYRPAVLGRMAIARALRDRGMATTTIARVICRADHTTVLNNLKKYDDYVRTYTRLGLAYDAIKAAESAAMDERLAA